MYAIPPSNIIIQSKLKLGTKPTKNITSASNNIEHEIRYSAETIDLNFGNIAIPPITAPIPKDPNSRPYPMESSPSSCLAKNGKRDNNALLHNVNKPVRTINIWTAWE